MLVLYVFVPNDFKTMNPGKAEAHSGHAATQFMYNAMASDHVMKPQVLEWVAESMGAGTQINLSASSNELKDLRHRIVTQMKRDERFVAQDCADVVVGRVTPDPEAGPIMTGMFVDKEYPFTMPKELYELYVKDTKAAADCNTTVVADNGNEVVLTRIEATAYWFFGEKEDLEPYLGSYALKA